MHFAFEQPALKPNRNEKKQKEMKRKEKNIKQLIFTRQIRFIDDFMLDVTFFKTGLILSQHNFLCPPPFHGFG